MDEIYIFVGQIIVWVATLALMLFIIFAIFYWTIKNIGSMFKNKVNEPEKS